jgi:hypothetical protein
VVVKVNKRETFELIDSNVNEIEQLIDKKVQIWFDHVLFSDLWWMGVALSVIPWIIWFYFRRRQSTDRLLYVGFYVMTISVVLDLMGDQLGLWHYRYLVVPVLPTYFPWDTTLMPLTVIFLLQIKPNINPWYKATFFALLTSYGAEPLFDWIGVYEPTGWRYSYSIPIQMAIYMSAHYLSRRNKFAELTGESKKEI